MNVWIVAGLWLIPVFIILYVIYYGGDDDDL